MSRPRSIPQPLGQPATQRSFEDLGTPLSDVTFCVIDLETTGGAAADGGITEIGAVKVCGGEVLGTFQTLVDPGRAIPPEITVLTGITQSMVTRAPRTASVLPSLLEFLGDSIIVGHNVRYDISFLAAELERGGQAPLQNRRVDTLALARRLVRDEVPNCKLATLADRLRLDHRPSHRALDDALATTDLLHLLLERAGSLGVSGLDDLLALPTMAGHPQAAKLRLTEDLPRAPGVYLFLDRAGRVLYVGKATDLRARVRSYFSGDERRKIGQLLRETHHIDHRVCSSTLEAAVAEIRLIHEHLPRFNRQHTRARKYRYLKLTDDRFPRLSVVQSVKGEGFHLGPLSSTRAARIVAEAIESAVALRRCTRPVPRSPIDGPCTAAQLGVSTCPCSGGVTPEEYGELVQTVIRGCSTEPDLLLEPLRKQMEQLAAQQRFEEAADARAGAEALAGALQRQRRLDTLRRSGRLLLELPDGGAAELISGRLGATRPPSTGGGASQLPFEWAPPVGAGSPSLADAGPIPVDQIDELVCVAGWLDKHADRIRIEYCDRALWSPLPAIPRFTPRKTGLERRR
ncbi:MAG: DEDD exonuclease domain-containing protein [Actinomycetia bacterium]|nr:DEDD exonuclease domain-containing protein [Actinomycetes bacterium]